MFTPWSSDFLRCYFMIDFFSFFFVVVFQRFLRNIFLIQMLSCYVNMVNINDSILLGLFNKLFFYTLVMFKVHITRLTTMQLSI